MRITIEPLQLPELVAFLRIQADDCFPDLKDEERLNMLAEKWHKYAEVCTCRDEDSHLVGMIAFYANKPKVAYIPHIYVSKELRGKGTFAAMLSEVSNYVKSNYFQYIRLEVRKDNMRAISAYKKQGFLIDGDMEGTSSLYMTLRIY